MTKKIDVQKWKRHAFYYGMLLIPLLQFCVFYIYVNFDSFYMAFTNYDYNEGFVFVGFDVFKGIFYKFDTVNYYWGATWRSILLTVVRILIGIPIPLVFSYYLFKKFFGHKFFKVMLFLPTMVSAIVLVTIFKNFVECALTEFGELFGLNIPSDLLFNPKKSFPVVMIYYLWMGLGSQLILYTGAMSTISESITEAAAIDGASSMREFFSIVIPSVWSTIVTFIVIRLATTFTEMMSLYDFYGGGASEDIMTIGYYLYKTINNPNTKFTEYPELSAMGLIFTLVNLPVVIGAKWLLEKFGPSEE